MISNHAKILVRDRVTNIMTESLTLRPLTILVAPMGYGKTTAAHAMAERLAATVGRRALFVTFPPEKCDAAYLWKVMWSQLHNQGFTLAEKMLKSNFPFAAEERRTVLTLLQTTRESPVLVLDDYHFIGDEAFNVFLSECVREGIAPLSILVLSRTKPDLPIEELSLKGKAALLGQEVLEFTEAEAKRFFRLRGTAGAATCPDASDRAARSAWHYSRGWATALWFSKQNWLKHGSFRQPPDLDALLGENLATSFSTEERNLLMRLSLLEGFSQEDAAFLDANPGTVDLIPRLAAKAALIHFDPATQRYCLHDIFRSFLAKKLSLSDIASPDLYRRVAECCIRRNELIQAATHLGRAGRDEDMLRILEVVVMPDGSMPLFYFTREVVDVILSIPWRLRLERPIEYLSFLFCYLIDAGNASHRYLLDEAFEQFHEAQNLADSQRDRLLHAVRRIAAILDCDDYPATAELGVGAAPGQIPSTGTEHWSWAFGCPHAGYLYLRKPGKYRDIAGLIGKSIRAYRDMTEGGIAGSSALFAAERHLERGEFDAAAPLLRAAMVQGESFDLPAVRMCAWFCQARLHLAEGRADEARLTLASQQDEADLLNHANYDRCVDLSRCHIHACLGELAEIPGWLKEERIAPNLIIVLMKGLIYSLQGKTMLLSGKYDHLEALAQSLSTSQGAFNNLFGRIHAKVLKSVAAWNTHRPAEAHALFGQAVDLARPDGIVLSIAEYGSNILPLATEASVGTKHDPYLRRLVSLTKAIAEISSRAPAGSPLTPRQKQFLRFAGQGKSNAWISRHAGVTLDTVKKTLTAAYARLGVKNRAEAVLAFTKTRQF